MFYIRNYYKNGVEKINISQELVLEPKAIL
jgi:hypothetical protein